MHKSGDYPIMAIRDQLREAIKADRALGELSRSDAFIKFIEETIEPIGKLRRPEGLESYQPVQLRGTVLHLYIDLDP